MKFEYISYLPLLVIFFIVYIFLIFKVEKKNRKTIKLYWFYDFSKKLKFSNLLYIVGLGFLLIALLDLRGKPEKHSAKIPKQKTIILMDTSLSMNAEDVRPNRFKKSVLLARHMIKKLVGHSVSVIIFSDIHKRLVPFTSDLDLLDSRISGLNELKIRRGGTNLSSVLMESLSYLKDDEGNPVGNVILLTDAEENEIPVNLKIPNDVSVALLAVGTKQGGKIPIRGSTGMYIGSKRFGGKEVITKIDEATIKRFAKDIKFFKYWITNTYSLPTEDVVTFLNKTHKAKFSTGEVISKPVLGYKIIVAGFLFIILSSLGSFGKVLVKTSIFLLLINPAYSQQQNPEKEEEKKELSKLGKELLERLKNANATESERLKLAEQYMLAKHNELSDLLYEKNLKDKYIVARVNSALPKIALKNLSGALEKYHDVLNDLSRVQSSDSVEKIKEVIRTNTLLVLAQKKQQQQQKQNQKDQKNKKGGGGGSSDKDKKKDDKGEGNKNQKKQNQKDKNDQKNKDENKQKQKQQKQKKKKVKIPSLLKQLVNDDRKLQGKMLDTTTYKGMKRGERRSRVKKNW